MTNATKPFSNRIAIVFDFDETLAPDTFAVLLEDLGLDAETFKQERVKPLRNQGWDKYIARAYCLVEESKQRPKGDKLTQQRLAKIGKELKLYEEVSEMFERLRQCARNSNADVELEFYLITGGFLDIISHTSIAKQFRAMWGSQLHFDQAGEVKFIKQQMTNTEKTGYLLYLSKGIENDKEKDLMFAYRSVPDHELYIPLTQVIYVGDGASDAPCFTVLNQHKGTAIGLYQGENTEEWKQQDKIDPNQRVDNLAVPDYSENSELMQSLTLAVEAICKQIALRRLSVGE